MEYKEIIEDQLVCIISKDYLDVFSKHLHCSVIVMVLFKYLSRTLGLH